MKQQERRTALLIDANALLHRAWHALPPLTAPGGQVVNAVYGFASVLINVLKNERPEYLVVCWDTEAATFRHEAAPEYKAQREEQPQEFYDQVPLVKQVVETFGGTNVELDGYEADDLLGTFATRLAKDGVDVTVLTSDKDAWQLIGPRIRVMAFKKGVSETIVYDEQTLKDTTGLTPQQIVDYKAMRGDASDNLKGVPGIGEKTATELLQKFGDLKRILKAAHDDKSDLSPALRKKLIDGEQAALSTLPLVKLVLDVPFKAKIEDLKRRAIDEERVKQFFFSLGFKSLVTRMFGGGGAVPAPKASTRETSVEKQETRTVAAHATPHMLTDIASLSAFLESVKKENALIVHPLFMPQGSLFTETAGLALGSAQETVVLASSLLEQAKAKTLLANVLADATIRKVGHGLKHAWHWCVARGMDLDGIEFDTEIASYLLATGEGGHDLASLAASRLGLVFPDGEGTSTMEVNAIRQLSPLLKNDLEEQKLTRVWERFERPLIPVLGQMEELGIFIDIPYFKKLTEEFRTEKARLEREMVKLAGEEFNPASPPQLSRILFEVLNIPVKGIKRGKTGISTAASELEKLEGAHPIIEKISEYREVAKLLSTYVETMPVLADAEGRVHTTYIQIGAATGRMSSTNPNLQNIPIRTELGRKIRRGFIAKEGYLLLSCDYSQIELRVIAALAKDEKMLEAFRKKLDIHTATAAAIWHIPLDEVTKDQRRAAKAINFGVIYGQGPQGLSKAAGIPFEEAKQFIDEYFQVYSGVKAYLDQTKALAHAQGYVETLFGRRRSIPEINSPLHQVRTAAERMAINMPVQGTATGDLIKLAVIALAKELPKHSSDARLLLQVHDELVLEVPEHEVERIARVVRDVMENVESIGCPIVVEAKAGKNWEEMDKLDK